ncbi:MAG: hypothetical protein KKA07_14450 [Bacteroidetes bacterium]|nr:hypothetical protein [Bacteroidota bacterium]MBU1720261.1 hypothetical protein [Bacteroidota bacterium]
MKMLIPSFFLLFFSYCLGGYAQDSSAVRKHKHELGLDGTYVLKAPFASQTVYVYSYYDTTVTYFNGPAGNKYIITYCYNIGDRLAIRFGYGQSIANLRNKYESESLYTSSSSYNLSMSSAKESSKHTFLYSRLGIQYNTQLGNKWQCYFGADFVGAYKFSYSKYEDSSPSYSYYLDDYESETETKSTSYGGGPVIGIKYWIGERVAVSTETSLYYLYTESVTDRSYEYSYGSSYSLYEYSGSSKMKDHGYQIDLNLPTMIYVTFRF